ncbi:MAG: hypothetical protein IT450_04510 [Phycisphaerales bacterium]|nr:hypothetical protein [Phycisphaerales bacterium]
MAKRDPLELGVKAGILAWLIPGGGHWIAGHRGLAHIYFWSITFAYVAGMLVGGAKGSVDPRNNGWLFLAELGIGGYTVVFWLIANAIPTIPAHQFSPYLSIYPEADISMIYLSVAGLLNVLAILDAIARTQTDGLPVFHHEQKPATPAEERA